MNLLVLLGFALLVSISLAATPRGVLPLDSYTFDKIVDGSRNVLVKFDKQYAYGEKQDAWTAFAETVRETSGILLAEVGVNDYGDKDNDDLRARFDISADDFPVYKAFTTASGMSPIDYTRDITTEGLATFVKTDLGIWVGLSGCVEALDALATDFCSGEGAARDALLAQAADVDAEEFALKHYTKTMNRIVERGDAYPSTEIARLQGLLDSQSQLSDEKKSHFQQRINILGSFANCAADTSANQHQDL